MISGGKSEALASSMRDSIHVRVFANSIEQRKKVVRDSHAPVDGHFIEHQSFEGRGGPGRDDRLIGAVFDDPALDPIPKGLRMERGAVRVAQNGTKGERCSE
jgi:hypothetical protein